MRRDLLDILRCPLCKSVELELETRAENESEVSEGVVACSDCGRQWPVSDGIVDMLLAPPDVTKREVEGRVQFVDDTRRTKPMDDEWLLGLPESAFFVPTGKNRDFVDNLSKLSALAAF